MSTELEQEVNAKPEKTRKQKQRIKSLKIQEKRKKCKHQHVKKDGLSTQKEPKQKMRCMDCNHVWTVPLPKKVKAPKKKARKNQKAKKDRNPS